MKLRLFVGVSIAWLLSACSSTPINTSAPNALPFVQAANTVADTLFKSIQAQQPSVVRWFPTTVAVEPAVNAHSLEVLQADRGLLNQFQSAGKRYKVKDVLPLNRSVLARSTFLIQTQISYEPLKADGTKHYHLMAVARDLRSGKMIASSDAWISDDVPNYKPTKEFNDIPNYLAIYKTPVKPPEVEPLSQLKLRALLSEAGEIYNQGQYQKALDLYQQAYNRGGNKELRTLAGLYISNLRLNKSAQANQIFDELLRASFQQNDKLTLKILFKVGSTDFYGSAFTQNQYHFWIDTITKYLPESRSCLIIAGHSSHSGTAEYNMDLSLKRAQAIQTLMTPVKDRTKALGKGFSENIIGLGTDDERDAVDRRVEFSKNTCH